ncbi:MAG: hypothetical protein AAF641_09235 [Pseudomonadota bacterium]
MTLSIRLKRFFAEEDGAATVDWVVGTAAAVDTVERGVTTLSGNIAAAISSKSVNTGDGDG